MKKEIFKKLYLPSTIKRLEKKQQLLQVEESYDVYKFLNHRLLATIIIFLVLLVVLPFGYIFAICFSIIYYFGLEYLCFDIPMKKRVEILNKEALYFFEVLYLSLESNLTMYQAIKKTCENTHGYLTNEFKKLIKEVDMGKDITLALKEMKEKIPSPMISKMLLNLENASSLGNNVSDTVSNELEYLKENYWNHQEEHLNKLPFYVNIMSVMFLIITLSLIIICPILINMIK